MKKNKTSKRKILEQIKYFRNSLDTLEHNLNELHEIVDTMPTRQLDEDNDEDEQWIKNFMNNLQELGAEASCIESYTEAIERIFTGE